MVNAGTVDVGFRGDPREIEAAIAKVEKRLSVLEGRGRITQKRFEEAAAASKKFTLGIGVAGAAAGALGATFVSAAGKLELYKVQFEVMTGSAERGMKLMKELNEFALKTPFTITGIRDTATQLLAYGVAAENVIPTARRLGDLSAGNQQRFEQLAYAFGQVNAAGRLYATEVRQFSNAGVNALQALADYYDVTKAEADSMVRDGLVSFQDFNSALELYAKKFEGLMERGSETVPGILSNIGDAFTKFLESFNETGAYAGLKSFLKEVLHFVENVLPEMTKNMDAFLQTMVEMKGLFVIFAGVITLMVIPAVSSWVVGMISGLTKILAFYGPGLAAVTGAMQSVQIAMMYGLIPGIKMLATQVAASAASIAASISVATLGFGALLVAGGALLAWYIKFRTTVNRIYSDVSEDIHENITRIQNDMNGWVQASAELTGYEKEYADRRVLYSNIMTQQIIANENLIQAIRSGAAKDDIARAQLAIDNNNKLLSAAEKGLMDFEKMHEKAAKNAKDLYKDIRSPSKGAGGGSGVDDVSDKTKEVNKELERQQKLIEEITESSKRLDEARLRVMRDQLEMKEKSNTLSEREARTLERLKQSSDEAFDLNNAKDWNEFMEALADSTEDLADKYDDVTDAIAETREELKAMADDAVEAIATAQDKISEMTASFEEKFGAVGGSIGGEAGRDLSKDLAKEYVDAKNAVEDYQRALHQANQEGKTVGAEKGEKYVEALRIIEKIEGMMQNMGNGELTKSLREAVEMEQLDAVDKAIAKAENKKKIEEEALKKEIEAQQTIIDMNEAFRAGELESWIEQNKEVISQRELLEAQEMLAKEQRLKQELDKNIQVQQEISNTIGVEAGLRDIAMQNFHNNELARLDEMKKRAISTMNAIRSAMSASQSVSGGGSGTGFASGGFTGNGSNHQIAGFVHRNEYVIPAHMVKSLAPTGIIGVLERMRRGIGGFMEGGMVGGTSKTYSPTFNIEARDGLDVHGIAQFLLSQMRNA